MKVAVFTFNPLIFDKYPIHYLAFLSIYVSFKPRSLAPLGFMNSDTFLIKAPWTLKDFSYLKRISSLRQEKILVFSFCPYQRRALRKEGFQVVNPFKFSIVGDLEDYFIVLLEWASFTSPIFIEHIQNVFGGKNRVLLVQSLSFNGEQRLLERFVQVKKIHTLIKEKCPRVLILKSSKKCYQFGLGLSDLLQEKVLPLKDPFMWPSGPGKNLVIGLPLENFSFLLALSARHRIWAVTSNKAPWSDKVIAWPFLGQSYQDLVA